MSLVVVAYALDKTPTLHTTHAYYGDTGYIFLTQKVDDQHGIPIVKRSFYQNPTLKTGYIEFARLEYYADTIHSAIVNPAG